ncbi:MAG: spore protease YyaC [Lachnospiraceae bacterium]|nr:spore protease YyaC [Lachnospiraceae bacterium]
MYLNAFESDADKKLYSAIKKFLHRHNTDTDNVVILCIGTDRATGDCLGPLVGNHLKKERPDISVFGTLERPVHALNLEETLETIHEQFDKPFIIAIDASLGVPEHIGYATVCSKPLLPGKGVNKKLPAIGNLSITGIVNVAGFPNSVLLQSTRLHTVMTLADCIGNAISMCYLPAPL